MATKKQQQQRKDANTKTTVGTGIAAYGAANTPFLHAGSKDKSKMVGASPKLQAGRYQAELHNAMKSGKVKTDEPVKVFKTPSGRYVNAGGTHRKVARDAMGKPSRYEVKSLDTEFRISPAQKATKKLKMKQLERGSKRAEAGKKVRPVGRAARAMNRNLAAAADGADDMAWHNPSMVARQVKVNTKAGLASGGLMTAGGAALAASGIHDKRKLKKVSKSDTTSAFGVDHGYEIAKYDRKKYGSPGRLASGAMAPGWHGAIAGKEGHKVKAAGSEVLGSMLVPGGGAAGAAYANKEGWLKKQPKHKIKPKKKS